jgi:nucleoside-diphosphate-sugar epimerase
MLYATYIKVIMSNLIEQLEKQELIQKLMSKGYAPLIDALLANEKEVYTKKGRLNKSGACRVLGWKPKELEQALEACRDILKNDLFFTTKEEEEQED